MPFLMDTSAIVLCAHGAQAKAVAPEPRVTLGGQPVVVQPRPFAIAGCPFTQGPKPSPCVTAIWLAGSTRVTANGQPILLQSSQATCAPNGTPVNIVSTQVRVEGQ